VILNNSNTSLCLVIDNNDNLLKEAFKAVNHWRSNSKGLEHIPIFLVSNTLFSNPLLDDILSTFDFISFHFNDIFTPKLVEFSPFFNMPSGCAFIEQHICTTSFLIYIDCDMYLKKQFPLSFSSDLVVEKYSFDFPSNSEAFDWSSNKHDIDIFFSSSFDYINTEFIISKISNNVFLSWFTEISILDIIKTRFTFDISGLEEYAFEKVISSRDKVFLSNFVARINSNSYLVPSKDDILFISSHNSNPSDIYVDMSDPVFSNFVPTVLNIELTTNRCFFNCSFCNERKGPHEIMSLSEFKQSLLFFKHSNIKILELTPRYGDILSISNISDYLDIVDNCDWIDSYFFYTSFSMSSFSISILDSVFSIPRPKLFVNISCYSNKNISTFVSLTNTNDSFRLIHENSILHVIENSIVDLKIMDRTGSSNSTSDFASVVLSNPFLKHAVLHKKLVTIESTHLISHSKTFIDSDLCCQFGTCMSILPGGDLIFCNYGSLDDRGPILFNIFSDPIDFSSMFSIDRLNSSICNSCVNKDVTVHSHSSGINFSDVFSFNVLDSINNKNISSS
jgi:hypothetical protein